MIHEIRLWQIRTTAAAILAGKRVLYVADSAEKECRFWWAVAEFIYYTSPERYRR